MSEIGIRRAVRRHIPVIMGIAGASGTGKTMSALRVATGMARVTGKRIVLIDTEVYPVDTPNGVEWHGRSEQYADYFDFDILPFPAPYTPARCIEQLEKAVAWGAGVAIFDSASDEHEGKGGMLEAHEREQDRLYDAAMAKYQRNAQYGDRGREPEYDNFSQLAWRGPKDERRKMIDHVRRMGVHQIFCYRAKERSAIFGRKARPGAQGQKDADGYVAVTDPKWFYELTLRALLLPLANGVPTWNPVSGGEREFIKRPAQFEELLRRFEGKPLCEDIGEGIARWALGDTKPAATQDDGSLRVATIEAAIGNASTAEELDAVLRRVAATERQGKITAEQRATLESFGGRRRKILSGEVVE